jgi:hypothetical protein
MRGTIALVLFCVLLFVAVGGCGVHPTCTSHCDQSTGTTCQCQGPATQKPIK